MKKLIILGLGVASLFAYPQCTMCHNGSVAVDLSKMSYEEIKQDLMKFKKGEMKHSMMNFVKDMSDKEIDEAARKYSKEGDYDDSGY